MYKFAIHVIKKFILLSRKVFATMNTWIFGKKSMWYHCKKKKGFESQLNMEDITDTDYIQAKRVCKDFEIKKLGEYHDVFVQNDILLLADVFENTCIE